MFLAIAFGFFLAAPLAVLVWSVARTAVGVSRGAELAAAAEAATSASDAAPIVVAGRRVTLSKGAVVPKAVAVEPPAAGTLLEFPLRDAQLARLRQQVAVRA